MKNEKCFKNKDIYFIEIVADKIVVNDNYGGVMILDSEFNVVQKIKLIDGLMIYSSFVKDDEIILYCYENQCLININVSTYKYHIIYLDKTFDDIIFLPLYEWKDNGLMLLADDGKVVVSVNLLSNNVRIMQTDTLEDYEYVICDEWRKLRNYQVYKIYPDKHSAVIKSKGMLVFMDYKDNTQSVLKMDNIEFHDIEALSTNYIAQISEREISLLYDNQQIMLYPGDMQNCFLRAKFIEIDNIINLIILSSNSDSTQSKITKCYCT